MKIKANPDGGWTITPETRDEQSHLEYLLDALALRHETAKGTTLRESLKTVGERTYRVNKSGEIGAEIDARATLEIPKVETEIERDGRQVIHLLMADPNYHGSTLSNEIDAIAKKHGWYD